MIRTPRSIRVTFAVFRASVLVAAGFGITFVWAPPESETVFRAFYTVLIVLFATMLILGGYGSVNGRARRGF